MKELFSTNDNKVEAAIARADKKGTVEWIAPLLEAFSLRENDALKERMREMLSSVKLSAAEDIYLDTLRDKEKTKVHADVLGFLWSAGFNPSEQIDLIVKCATAGDYRSAMEGLTIVEQCEIIENEQVLLEAIISVREAIESEQKKEVRSLLVPMLEALEHLERNQ